jgi:mono/diheme cytochrome c family protein
MRCAAAILSASLLLVSACSKETPPADPEVAPEPAAVTEPALDPVTGLKMAGDWEIVRTNCVACHSSRLITQQRGTSQQWLTMIRWMQKKQNLWAFDPDTESRIIAYLAENYPPSDAQRRPAIPPELMPPNPYSVEK